VACLGGARALPLDSDRCNEERALIVVGPGEGNGSVIGAGLLDPLLSAWARLALDDESGSGSWAVFSSTPAMLHLGGFVGLQGGSTQAWELRADGGSFAGIRESYIASYK
jgi:hypothetical protein